MGAVSDSRIAHGRSLWPSMSGVVASTRWTRSAAASCAARGDAGTATSAAMVAAVAKATRFMGFSGLRFLGTGEEWLPVRPGGGKTPGFPTCEAAGS